MAEANLKWWTDNLQGLPFLNLPTDYPRPVKKQTSIEAAEEILRLDDDLCKLLLKFSVDTDVKPFEAVGRPTLDPLVPLPIAVFTSNSST